MATSGNQSPQEPIIILFPQEEVAWFISACVV